MKHTVLLIEDSPAQAKFISQMILNAGYNAFTALNLKHGLETLKTQHIDIILSDLILPDAPDASCIRQIKKDFEKTVVIAMTAGTGKVAASRVLLQARADGAEFLLQKPFDISKLKTALEEADRRIISKKNPPHILVVDDSKPVRSICLKILEKHDYRVTLAEDMDEALEKINVLDLDVILTDLNMPGTDPREVIPFLSELLPGVGVVVMTGEAQKELSGVLSNGSHSVIEKPFNEDILLRAVRNAQLIAKAELLKYATKA